MFSPQNPIEYGDLEIGPSQDGTQKRSRHNTLETVGRGRRTTGKKRNSRKKAGAPIMGISHRRNHKWSW
jgi:hypothetical protein